MSIVEIPERPAIRRQYPGGRTARVWRWTVGSGVALVVLAAVHLVAQHFVVDSEGGLRTYQQVLDYIANPIIFVVEGALVLAVTIHAMLGLRGILLDLDLDPGPRARSWIDRWLWALGTLTVGYAFALLIVLAIRA